MKKSLIVLTSTLSLITFSALAENPKQAKTEQQTKIEKNIVEAFQNYFNQGKKQSLEQVSQLEKQLTSFIEETSLKTNAKNAGLLQTLLLKNNARIFLAALTQAELLYILQDSKPHTLLIPTDQAFDKLPQELRNKMLQDKSLTRKIVLYHIYGGKLDARGLWKGRYLTSAESSKVKVVYWKKQLYANKARIIESNIVAQNGYIHMIDQVLLPPSIN